MNTDMQKSVEERNRVLSIFLPLSSSADHNKLHKVLETLHITRAILCWLLLLANCL